ncbi:sortase [Candidatus Peregrinibacteria bacterium]|nr:sortase [Candidatus Peregrinibacteria bacterium]
MASPKKNSPKPSTEKDRTKAIPISDIEQHDPVEEPLQRVIHEEENQHYELHIEAPNAAGEDPKIFAATSNTKAKKKAKPHKKHVQISSGKAIRPDTPRKTSGTSIRIWNFLEWIAVSALIFVGFFFAVNWGSYSELIKLKLDNLTGNFQLDPFIEQLITSQPTGPEGQSQELLPMANNLQQSAEQIPALSMTVAPPDDRIIIPRINKNVPIVSVSTENLIKRDWGALEADIQAALQLGVVHYPGTAQAGDTGNVVITGHSSYFPWDPGRFKDVFALLHEIVVGDEVIVYHDQKPYRYKVYETKVVNPDQVQVLTQEGDDRLTLITCTPVGTNLRRLIVLAEPVRGS